jgi:hypothetical protein
MHYCEDAPLPLPELGTAFGQLMHKEEVLATMHHYELMTVVSTEVLSMSGSVNT